MKKRIVIGIAAIVVVSSLALLIWLIKFRNTTPKTLGELLSEKYRNIETRVYICENGVMTPYVVLETDNYGDAVLLMREYAYPEMMMYRDENMYGAAGAYYKGSIVDDYLENTFFNFYSDGMRSIIRESPVKIYTEEYVRAHQETKGPVMETIYRHVFALSKSEWGSNFWGLEKNDPLYEADSIRGIQKYAYRCYIWLRSETYGGGDTSISVVYDGEIEHWHLQKKAQVQPAFTVSRNTKIERYDGWGSSAQGFVFSCDVITDKK